ncbi:MAG: flagellar biosynthesis protein FlhF [Aureliella sp.]
MDIKTFRAESLQEALQLVRDQLGPDASVVQTREVKQSRFGVFRKSIVEVQASCDMNVARVLSPRDQPDASNAATQASHGTHESPRGTGQASTTAAPNVPPRSPAPTSTTVQSSSPTPTQHQASRMVSMRSDRLAQHEPVSRTPRLSPSAAELMTDLLEQGFAPQQASEILQNVTEDVPAHQQHDPWLLRGLAGKHIGARLNASGPIEVGEGKARVVAFVGPTGVGKTTTLAKIAAGFRFDMGLDVGMITIDTFRLGAVDQLLQYAELISSPLEVVNSPDEITSAMQRLRECDLVLIDTAGRSPRDAEQLSVLGDFMRAAQPDATQLVVSSATSPAAAADAIARYESVSPTNLILSKVDETVQLGSWYELLAQSKLPVSYITTGQHVPQDISVASTRRLASLLLGSSQHQEQPA